MRRLGAARAAGQGVLLALLVALWAPPTASAHGLVGRQDLPIPEWLFAWGASIVLIISFVALSVLWREPRLAEAEWRPLPAALSAVILSRPAEWLAGLIGVALLIAVVYTGLEGSEAPDRNFAITFVFVTFWLGLVVLSVLFGDVFRAFNPWRAIARAVGGGFRLVAGQPAPTLEYPQRLGRWPAVAGLAAFLWFELVYGQSGFSSAGVEPETLAIVTIIYSAVTFAGMTLYGVEAWTDRGEAFSSYFGMFARLAPLEARDGRLGRRRWFSGAFGWTVVPGSLTMVLVAIGGTTYDGAQEGALSGAITWTFERFGELGLEPTPALRITGTIWMAIVLAMVAAVFWAGLRGVRTVHGAPRLRELGRAFAPVFIPIALAYLVAHYFSLVIFQEQAQFTYLLSDPLGEGSNLFGTAGGGIDYTVVGATAIWYVQVGALVVGHAIALAMGHDRALVIFSESADATRSQYWMLALMVAFTCTGLFLLSQANA